MNKEISLELIVSEIKRKQLTAYKISSDLKKNHGRNIITEVGLNKILNGTSENPRKTTLQYLYNYLFEENKNLIEYSNDEIDSLFHNDYFRGRLKEFIKQNNEQIQ